MTPPVVARPDRADVAADIVARICDHTEDLVGDRYERRPDTVALLVADASLLVQTLSGWHGRAAYSEIADRLWMLGMPASEVHGLAVTTSSSCAEGLVTGGDAVRVSRACLRTLGGGR